MKINENETVEKKWTKKEKLDFINKMIVEIEKREFMGCDCYICHLAVELNIFKAYNQAYIEGFIEIFPELYEKLNYYRNIYNKYGNVSFSAFNYESRIKLLNSIKKQLISKNYEAKRHHKRVFSA